MKFQCTAGALRQALHHTQAITTKHSSLPVLAQTLFTANKDGISIRATNLSIGVECRVAAKIETGGTCACSGGLIHEIVATASPDELVSVEHIGNLLTIIVDKQQSTIKTVNNEDFPMLPKITDGTSFIVSPQDFASTAKSVMYAASSSDIKPEISSVYMYGDHDSLIMVATDSFRLAEKKLFIPQLPEIKGSMIPVKNIQHMVRSCSEIKEEAVTITISNTQITLSTPSWYCVSRLVDGNYPDYRQIIPTETITEVVVLRNDLMNALRTLNIFADTFQQVDIMIDPTTKNCSMIAENNDIGRTTAQVVGAITGTALETRCNGRYVQDCLSVITSDSIRMMFTSPNKPIVVRPVGGDDFLYLVMPMHRN